MTFYKIADSIYCNCIYIKDEADNPIQLNATLGNLIDFLKNRNVDGDIIKKYESCFNYIKLRFA